MPAAALSTALSTRCCTPAVVNRIPCIGSLLPLQEVPLEAVKPITQVWLSCTRGTLQLTAPLLGGHQSGVSSHQLGVSGLQSGVGLV